MSEALREASNGTPVEESNIKCRQNSFAISSLVSMCQGEKLIPFTTADWQSFSYLPILCTIKYSKTLSPNLWRPMGSYLLCLLLNLALCEIPQSNGCNMCNVHAKYWEQKHKETCIKYIHVAVLKVWGLFFTLFMNCEALHTQKSWIV